MRDVLAWLLARGRLKKATKLYRELGGGSPILKNTCAQAEALQKQLGTDYRVFVCMRHAPPFLESVLEEVKQGAYEKIFLLPLFPQYSTTTTGSFFELWNKTTKGVELPLQVISSYPTLEGFIAAMVEKSRPYIAEAEKYGTPKILLAAHGLPEKIINKGDPYQKQVLETAEKFKEKIGEKDTTVCYQSRVGWMQWIKPYLEDSIVETAKEGRPLVVVPISFVSEHSETLVELDILMRDLALSTGCPYYGRVPTVQTHPLFVEGLSTLITD